jgi:hypothetical protein
LQALLGGNEATTRVLLQQLMNDTQGQSAPSPLLQPAPQPRGLQATRSAQQAALLAALQGAGALPQHTAAAQQHQLVRPAASAPFLPRTGPLMAALSSLPELATLLHAERRPATSAAPVLAAAAAAAAAVAGFAGGEVREEQAAKRARQALHPALLAGGLLGALGDVSMAGMEDEGGEGGLQGSDD